MFLSKKKPTSHDVARLAGVSQSTVSMILNNKPDVSFLPETIEKVYSAARQLNYKVRRPRQTTLSKQDQFIAVVTPTLANPYYSTLVQSLENQAALHQYGVLACNTYHDPATENHYLDLFSKSGLKGIVYAFMPYHWEKVKALSLSIPTVVIGDKNQSIDIDTVELNSTEAGQLLAAHLLELGHKKMVFITTPLGENNLPRIRRLEGMRSQIKKAGAELLLLESNKRLKSHRHQRNLEYNVGYELAKPLLNDDSITAYIAVNDMIAYGILDALISENIKVPQECSVAGFDNIFPSRFAPISLTTIDSFIVEKGHDAFELLFRKMCHEKKKSPAGICRIEYKPALVIRDSTGPAPKKIGKPAPLPEGSSALN